MVVCLWADRGQYSSGRAIKAKLGVRPLLLTVVTLAPSTGFQAKKFATLAIFTRALAKTSLAGTTLFSYA
jgi:hypothetical protein